MLPAAKRKKGGTTHGSLHDRAGVPSGSIPGLPDTVIGIEGITGPEGDAESDLGPSANFDAWDEGDISAAGGSTQLGEEFTSDVAPFNAPDHAILASKRQEILRRRWDKTCHCPDDSITGDRDEEDPDYDAVMDDGELTDEYSNEEDDEEDDEYEILDSVLPAQEAWDEEFIKKSIGMFSPS